MRWWYRWIETIFVVMCHYLSQRQIAKTWYLHVLLIFLLLYIVAHVRRRSRVRARSHFRLVLLTILVISHVSHRAHLHSSIRGRRTDLESGNRKQWTLARTAVCTFRYSYRGRRLPHLSSDSTASLPWVIFSLPLFRCTAWWTPLLSPNASCHRHG